MQDLSRRARAIIAALVAVIATVGVTLAVTIDEDPDRPGKPRGTVTITVGKPVAPGAVQTEPTTIEVPAAAVEQAARSDVGDHDDLAGESPAGAKPADLEAAREQQQRFAERDDLPDVTPLAAPEQAGCVTRIVANHSSRRGVRPRLLVAHYTVSPNRPGRDDVNAIVALFDRPAFQASSHYVIDDEGNCAYIVRESDKAWTQAAANPVSISVEVIATGKEGRLSTAAGFDKIGRVFADAAKRWEIPVQRGAVSGCTVTRPGLVDHRSLGACGGGHVDVSPYSTDPILEAMQRASSSSSIAPARLSPFERRNVECLQRERRSARRNGGWDKIDAVHLANAQGCKGRLRDRRALLERLGLDAPGRRARHRELGKVIRG